MNANTPPDPYFNNIDFNPTFYQVIQQYLTEAYANSKYLKLTGGSLSGFLGIGRTARTQLDVNGKVVINDNAISTSENGLLGGAGTRIILYEGSEFNTPYAFGINTNTLWYSVPSTATHRFYIGTNERMVIDSVGDVGIGTANPQSKLTINPIPQHGTAYDYSLSPVTITNTNPTSTLVLNDPKPVLHLCREGTGSQAYASKATFNLCRYENVGVNSRTRLDLTLTHSQYDEINVLSIKSDGGVGIGTTNPITKCHIRGATPVTLRLETDASAINQQCAIEMGIPAFNTNSSSKITATARAGNISDLQFITSSALDSASIKMTIRGDGNVGIGTTDPGTHKLSVIGTASIGSFLIVGNDGTSIPYVQFGPTNGHNLGVATEPNVFSTSALTGDMVLRAIDGKKLILQNGIGAGSLIIDSNNNVGIGTTSAGTNKLYVNGKTLITDTLEINNEKGILFSKTSTSAWIIEFGNSPTSVADSMIFYHRETSPGTKASRWWFNGAQTNTSSEISDERIKKEINDIQTPLNKIMELKPKEYYLCDDKDYNKKFGIIAQDVEKIFPELIHTSNDYIANIYSYAKYNDFIITLDKDISNLINIDDELKIVLDNDDKNNLEIVLDDTPYSNRYKRRFVKVIEIIDNYSFKIDIDIGKEDIFVYGKKVDDFKRLDYESLYCLNLAGTQELYKIIQQLQDRISALEKI